MWLAALNDHSEPDANIANEVAQVCPAQVC